MEKILPKSGKFMRVVFALILIVSSCLNILVWSNYKFDLKYAYGATVTVTTEGEFKEAFTNGADGTVIDLGGNQNFTVRGDNETWITNNHNVTVTNGTLNLRYSGILCNGDLSFDTVELNIISGAGAVIVANGHTLNFNNVTRYSNTPNYNTIFAGTVVNSSDTIPAAGNWSSSTINVKGKNDLGKIFMGNYDAKKDGTPLATGMTGYGKEFASCTVNIDETCTQYSKTAENRAVYASGGFMESQNNLVATPAACPVTSVATINTYEDRILTVEGETGRNWPKATYNYYGGEYVTDNVTLHNMTSVQVKSGKFQLKADSTFASPTFRTRLGVASGALLYAGNLGDASFMYFDGGGTLNLGASKTNTAQTLTFLNAVTGTTELEFGNTPNFKYAGVLDSNYIVASQSGADVFAVSNPASGQQGYWNRTSKGEWLFSSTKPGEHVHDYGNYDHYFYDENEHWLQCLDAGCPDLEGSKTAIAEHEYDDDNTRKCSYCDYKRVIINDIFYAKDDSKLELFKERVFNSILNSNGSIEVSDLGLTYNDITYTSKEGNKLTGSDAARSMVRDHPFFSTLATTGDVTFEYSGNTISKVNYTIAQYTWTPSTISLALEAYEEAMDLIGPSMTTVQKLAVLHDWECNHITYSLGAMMADFAIGGLANGKAVCAGYAQTYQFFLDQLGIENVYVSASTPKEPHAWNLVKVDGYWFHVDTTWDDGVAGSNSYHHSFFLLNDDEFKESGDDDGDGVGTHGTDWLDQKKYPSNTEAYFANKYWVGVSGQLSSDKLAEDPKLTVKKADCEHKNTKIRNKKVSTCSIKGHSGDKYCTVCGELLNKGEELDLDPSNHEADKIVDVPEVPSTCKTAGKSAYKHCEACNKNVTEPSNLPLDSSNHEDVVEVPEVSSTCTTQGWSSYKHCNACGVDVTQKKQLPLAAHDLDENGVCKKCHQQIEPKPEATVSLPKIQSSVGSFNLLVNGSPVNDGDKVKEGDTISVKFSTTTTADEKNPHLYFVNKITVNGIVLFTLNDYDKTDWKRGDFDSIVASLEKGKTVDYGEISDLKDIENFDVDVEVSELIPVFRLYKHATGEHLFTPLKEENYILSKVRPDWGWEAEGIDWFSSTGTGNKAKIQRFYNREKELAGVMCHYYTSEDNAYEIGILLNSGWVKEDNNTFYNAGDMAIYKAYHSSPESWHYTSDLNEYRNYLQGWDKEPIANGFSSLEDIQHSVGTGFFKCVMSTK